MSQFLAPQKTPPIYQTTTIHIRQNKSVRYVAARDKRMVELVYGYSDLDVDDCVSENVSINYTSDSNAPLKIESIKYLSQSFMSSCCH